MRDFARRAVIGAWATVAISLLGGLVASGSAVAAPVASVYASGFNAVDDVKFDTAGNLYVNDNGGASRPVWVVAPGGAISTFVTGRSYLVGMAFDSAGNLFVNESGGQLIDKITPAASISTFVTFPGGGPRGIVFDGAGNLYVALYTMGKVVKVTPGGVVSDYATVALPWALAFDSTGNLFVSRLGNAGSGSVVKVAAGCAVPCSATTFMTGLTNPQGLAVDGADNLFASALDGVIRKATPGGVVSTVSTDPLLNGPTGMTFDTAGNLFVGNFSDGKVIKLAAVGVPVAPPVPVPTLSIWWLISLALAMAGSGVIWLRLRAADAPS